MIAKTLAIPYYAVVFTATRTDMDAGYEEMVQKMTDLAQKQDGFLGIESSTNNKLEISVSYWSSIEAIKKWKDQTDHEAAQKLGRKEWYKSFKVRISQVVRDYEFTN